MDMDIHIIGDVLETVAPYFERVRPFLLDLVVGTVLLLAFVIGTFKAWRHTVVSILVQWVCLGLGFLLAALAAPRLVGPLLGIGFVEHNLAFMPRELVVQMLSSVLMLLVGIFIYALLGSILFAFAKSRAWHKLVFPKRAMPKVAAKLLAGGLNFLHAYTYVFFFLAFLSLPFFNIIPEGSLSDFAFNANVVGAPLLDDMAQPFADLYETMEAMGSLDDIIDGTSIDYDNMAQIINNDPERLAEIQEILETQLPVIPAEVAANFEAFAQRDGVTGEEVRDFLLQQVGSLDGLGEFEGLLEGFGQ
ncbi:MAG: hypothetical protein FWF59_06805 [Turicibacter sp.]|nr:hypothetical protein [Turicibacter sp.]